MPRFSILSVVPVLIFFSVALVFYFGMKQSTSKHPESTLINKFAPQITQRNLRGFEAITKDSLVTGEIVLVNFWASWCPPCRLEHPQLMELSTKGINILGVNIKDDEKNAKSFLDNYGNPFSAIAFDPKGRSAIDWGVTAPPETFVIDANGKVLFRFAGPLFGADYAARFEPAFRKIKGKK